MREFLAGFGSEKRFDRYLDDPTEIPPASQLSKSAGQLCYLSFGESRTTNDRADRYLANIKESGHGSVLEHPTFTFLFYGVSRSLTHELVRHRAGTAFSQVSQRYVDGSVLRFVERPEYQDEGLLHQGFEESIDAAAERYHFLASELGRLQEGGDPHLAAEARRDLRKRVQQAARSCLPNDTEAPIIFSANCRALRHIIEMRASEHAEIEIRNLFLLVFLCMATCDPLLFDDYRVEPLADGSYVVKTDWRKV